MRVSRGERGRAPCARSPSRTRPLRAATGPRRSRDRSDARGAGFRASQALRSERAGSRRGTHLAVDLDRLQGRPRAILGLARARREVHRDEARVSVARTGAARKEGEPRSARGSRSAAKKMPHVDGIGPADTSQNSVGRCDVAVYVSGGNNEARTLHVRVDAARASDMRLANARLAALAVVLGIVAVAAQDDLDLDFDPTQQDVRSALVLSRFLAPFEMKVVASGADTRSPTRWTATGARSGSRRPPTRAR